MPTPRRAHVTDATVLGRLNGIVHGVHSDALPDVFKAPDAEAAAQSFGVQLGREDVVAFIAEVDGEAVGYALAEEQRRDETSSAMGSAVLYLHHLAVDPSVRLGGIGRALMASMDEEAQRRRLCEIRLDYWSFNDVARRFFTSLGYEPYQERARRRLDASN